MKKRWLSMILSCSCLLGCATFSIAALETNGELTDSYRELFANFDPQIEFQSEEAVVLGEVAVEPIITPELKTAMETADPRSAVSYDANTGEVSLKPYEASRESDVIQTAPSCRSPFLSYAYF